MLRESSEESPIVPENPQLSLEPAAADVPAWTEIESGRFMPRRIRGSCQGRALG